MADPLKPQERWPLEAVKAKTQISEDLCFKASRREEARRGRDGDCEGNYIGKRRPNEPPLYPKCLLFLNVENRKL